MESELKIGNTLSVDVAGGMGGVCPKSNCVCDSECGLTLLPIPTHQDLHINVKQGIVFQLIGHAACDCTALMFSKLKSTEVSVWAI